ncbi:MAG: Gfo/Idh/MocA family oxidoreductase [Balneolales bacterium]
MDNKVVSTSKIKSGISRRRFIGSSAALAGGVVINPLGVGASAHAAGSDTLKLALVGCGSRGAGAVRDALRADQSTELVAMADIFRDQLDRSYDILTRAEGINQRIKVPEKHKFVGLEGYKKAIELADVVLLVTPPAFRPLHFEAAVNAGKHCFLEKPLSSDAPGNRRILAAGKQAGQQGLRVMVGLQNRYAVRYQNLIQQFSEGAIGDITSMRCNYLIGGLTLIPRQAGQTEMEYQLRNWRHFNWLWAGGPSGLTIHMEDIAHWAKGSHPIRANGTGGRVSMRGPEHGEVFDTYDIEYEYQDGTRLQSRTRYIEGCWFDRGIYFQGTKGSAVAPASGDIEIKDPGGQTIWRHQNDNDPSPYLTEHKDFFSAIRNETSLNDISWAAESNMTSILGRMAAHSGKRIDWDEAFNSDLNLVPDGITFETVPADVPGEDGHYIHPVPGSGRRVL